MDAVDLGDIRADRFGANNLSFHEFSFKQRVAAGSLKYQPGPHGAKDGKLTNLSQIGFKAGALYANGKWYGVSSLPAGATIELKSASVTASPIMPGTIELDSHQIVFTAVTQNFRPGPKVGDLVESAGQMKIWAFLEDRR